MEGRDGWRGDIDRWMEGRDRLMDGERINEWRGDR